MNSAVIIADPVTSLGASLRPAIFIAEHLSKKGYEITLVTPYISESLIPCLKRYIKRTYSSKIPLIHPGSLAVFEAWIRSIFNHVNINSSSLVLNFSTTVKASSTIYYGQGPISDALADIYEELPYRYKIVYKSFSQLFNKIDKNYLKFIRMNTQLFLANSKYCAEMYRRHGIDVDGIIYPPINTSVFKPLTNNPTNDYVLVYFGKEIKYRIIRTIADEGVKIKAFGSKAPYIPKDLIKHPNIEYLGRVDNKTLINLYSNALYTLFPFTHEPFGYVPVESMSCGTPVLTFDKQGPKETVVHGRTGWLARTDTELIDLAIKIWKNGYNRNMRKWSREHAVLFDYKHILRNWEELLAKYT